MATEPDAYSFPILTINSIACSWLPNESTRAWQTCERLLQQQKQLLLLLRLPLLCITAQHVYVC